MPEGQPVSVKIWILGKNYPTDPTGVKTESVNSDASFKYEVTQTTTKTMYPGKYLVVVQHPMQNNLYDIDLCNAAANTGKVCNLQSTSGVQPALSSRSLVHQAFRAPMQQKHSFRVSTART